MLTSKNNPILAEIRSQYRVRPGIDWSLEVHMLNKTEMYYPVHEKTHIEHARKVMTRLNNVGKAAR